MLLKIMAIVKMNNIFVHDSSERSKRDPELIIDLIKETHSNFSSNNILEIYNQNNYLPNQLRLNSAIKFHCNMAGKNPEEFINLLELAKEKTKYKNILIEDMPYNVRIYISFFLYIFLNKVCIFYNLNLVVILEMIKASNNIEKLFNNIINENNMIYIQPVNTILNHHIHINKYFNNFAYIQSNKVRYFDNSNDFSKYLEANQTR
jgi:hypothetical protein